MSKNWPQIKSRIKNISATQTRLKCIKETSEQKRATEDN